MTVPLYKPSGWTSFDVVKKVRNMTRFKKVGHGGTLDPFAEGILIIGFGTHTKKLSWYLKSDKEYEATLRLGVISDTLDCMGSIEHISENVNPDPRDVKKILASFTGKQKQIPPMYSAKKVRGEALYKRARRGEEIEREAVDIEIYSIELLDLSEGFIRIRVACSSGTYIRVLVHDIGLTLGCGALTDSLIRLKAGPFNLNDSLTLEEFAEQWKSLAV